MVHSTINTCPFITRQAGFWELKRKCYKAKFRIFFSSASVEFISVFVPYIRKPQYLEGLAGTLT